MRLIDELTNKTNDLSYITSEAQRSSLMNEIKNISSRIELIDFIKSKEIKYHLTITFSTNLSETRACAVVSSILKMMKRDYYGKNKVKNKNNFISGFSIKHKKQDNSIHYHLLIEDNNIFYSKRNKDKDFFDVFADKCSRVKINNFNPINPRNCHLQKYYDDQLEQYLTRDLEYKIMNYDFLEPLTSDGMTFQDMSTKPSYRKFK